MNTAVFYMRFPETVGDRPLKNESRMREVKSAKNLRVAAERFWSFALLDAALAFLGAEDSSKAYRNECGKWAGLIQEFSLSHSGDAVAVAISDMPIGVDLQTDTGLKLSDALLNRTLSDEERAMLSPLSEDEKRDLFFRFWSAKESLFKRENKKFLHPKEYAALSPAVKSEKLTDGWLTVACDTETVERYDALIQDNEIKIINSERKLLE